LLSLAVELVARKVDVIAAPGSIASALAAKAATSTIPVVFETGADPIATGLVASLNRPAGNVTGVTSLNAEIAPKRLELLHELVPAAKAFALMVNPTNPTNAEPTTRAVEAAARALALRLHVLPASIEADFDTVFATVVQLGAGGLAIANETYYALRSEQLAAVAVRHNVPAVHQSREFALAGGLMGYGGSTRESHRQAGVTTGRILKGEKPADLPIQQVTKVEFALNLKAARAFGLNPSASFIARADEVIE
jgi:putative ABC transport system substrate-binding protein